MTSLYDNYLRCLNGFAKSHSTEAELHNVTSPLFNRFKILILNHQSTLNKFEAARTQILNYLNNMEYEEVELTTIESHLIGLSEIDIALTSLSELKIPKLLFSERDKFVGKTYQETKINTTDLSKKNIRKFKYDLSVKTLKQKENIRVKKGLGIFLAVVTILVYFSLNS